MRRIINQCKQCRLKTSKPGKQLMAVVPDSRLQLGFPPFAHVGADYFGHLMVRQRLNRYGCLFTCMTTRAVHLEVARDLSTDALINAIRRFLLVDARCSTSTQTTEPIWLELNACFDKLLIPGIRTRFTNIFGRATFSGALLSTTNVRHERKSLLLIL